MENLIGKIILTNDNIIKVSHLYEDKIYGFDIITESLICINKSQNYLVNPNVILTILKEQEKAKFNYVNIMFPKLRIEEKCFKIGISFKTYYRILKGECKNREPLK